MLYGRKLNYSKLFGDSTKGELITPKKLDNKLSHLWEWWRKEYIVNLKEKQKPATTKDKHPTVPIGKLVVMEEENIPR